MSIIHLTVIPESKKNTLSKISEDKYEIHLKAKPERNQANQLLILALAEYFSIPTSQIKILTGHHSPHKRVEILLN